MVGILQLIVAFVFSLLLSLIEFGNVTQTCTCKDDVPETCGSFFLSLFAQDRIKGGKRGNFAGTPLQEGLRDENYFIK